jgi:archaellum biogenesis ATPase FlaH
MDTEEYDLYVPPLELELNYGSEFSKVHEVIVKKLNENNGKGIILLHGDPGTGKSFVCLNVVREAQKKGYDVVYCDNECMSKEFIKQVLCDMVDNCVLTD